MNTHKPINILLIGNNPRDLGSISQYLRASRRKFHAEAVFCIRDCNKYIIKNQPDCILIDENLGQENVEEILDELNSDYRTNNLAITILRQENSPKIYYSAVQTYVIKEKLSKEGLTDAILKAIKSKKSQRYFYTTYSSNYSILGGTFSINKAKLSNFLMMLKKWVSLGNLAKN
ncbi:MAG: response regulator [Bacteroidota bacterium]|nr:response regulator [Bacteroidota bacterium]